MDPKLELKSRINNPFFDSPERNTLFGFVLICFRKLNTLIFLRHTGIDKGMINKVNRGQKQRIQ